MMPRIRPLKTLPLVAIALSAAALPTHGKTMLGSPTLVVSPTASGVDSCGLEAALLNAAPTLRPDALRAALSAWDALYAQGEVARPLLTVIDYSLPSTAQRMWVFDLASRRLLFHELVAHGKNSGEDLTESFSNEEGSLMTSLGAFVTGSTYVGRNGYSLRLRGMEPGVNDRAEARAIVMHGAPYVDGQVARKLGRLGRSHGCPALRPAIARSLIDEIKDSTLLYAWHPQGAFRSSHQTAALGVHSGSAAGASRSGSRETPPRH